MRSGAILVIVLSFLAPVARAANDTGGAGQKCGTFGWNLNGCSCMGATSGCSIDARNCSAPTGVFPIAYTNIGRCEPKVSGDCPPAGGIGRGGLPASEGGWNEPWINLDSAIGQARTQRIIEQAARKGFKAIEPDNTAEKVTVANLKFIVEQAAHYGMKTVIKNDEGTWKQFLAQYPQYKQNIAMVLAEDCNSSACTSNYRHFAQMGIPVVITGQNESALKENSKSIPASWMKVPSRSAVGVTNPDKPFCTDGKGVTPGPAPTQSDYNNQGQGQQPYQQPQNSGWSSPSPTTGGGSPSHNPGAGQWKNSDYDRLQPNAKPSFLDPKKELPKEGKKNPFAKDDTWKEEEKKEVAKKKIITDASTKNVPLKKEETTFYDPLGGSGMKTSDADAISKNAQKKIPRAFGDAKIRCMPQKILRGARPTLAWSCGSDSTRSVGIGFPSKGSILGSTRMRPTQTTVYAIQCYNEDALIGSAQCAVTVSSEKPADESFKTDSLKTQEQAKPKTLCVFSFCI